ncbi:AAA family ATPase [Zwartia panacis]|uniref:AAA family ATPase n=1 Tax=Zwartia panacis TaxID=2683345 RepID=UPI0025B5549C|nr:AAA family ATPase [Zwartia panacis]MDN4015504.1 AAA family ATPase [Zwartia panacis]
MTIDELVNAAKFTVLIGKNGAGKSTLLRSLNAGDRPHIKYVSPERGGTLKYDPNVDNNINSNEAWLKQTRQTNRFEQFRQQSAAQFRNLETAVLREIEKEAEKRADSTYTFDVILEQINELLPAIRMIRNDKGGFSVQTKSGQPLDEANISSGESELIALAIEVLVFSRQSMANKMLLLDEPDVHLHPDLQQRFTSFVETVAVAHDLRVVIATHSTAIIGAFSKSADLQIVPISKRDQSDFATFSRSGVCEEILPIFGAHPLSTAFNRSPIVLVEGDDDRRVLEQVIRSGGGRFALAPCVVGSVTELSDWEDWLNRFLPVLYDTPKAFSLRDLDDAQEADINDLDHVRRIRLNCYAVENLLLSDQVLTAHGFSADAFRTALQARVERIPDHKYTGALRALVDDFENRRTRNIKDVRNILVAELGSNKPWEVLLGQLIAAEVATVNLSEHSIQTYLGPKAMTYLFH